MCFPDRRTWLDVGLSTEPADRWTTEEVLAELYARHHRGRPAFRWFDSPHAALPHLRGLPAHDRLMVELRVAPVPGGLDGEVELDRGGGKPAVVYRDGWST
jgi:hypothetical protein